MPIDYRDVIATQTQALAATVSNTPNDARVPACPDWSLADLGIHLGQVQRWATRIVIDGSTDRPARYLAKPGDGQSLADFLIEGVDGLLAALDAADLAAPCWNFTGLSQTKGFWLRRQAMEVSIHRWDGDSATGTPPDLPADEAVASIDEFMDVLLPSLGRRATGDLSHLTGDVHLHCTDAPGEWTFDLQGGTPRVRHGHGKATVAIRGKASDVALYLFNRVPEDRVEIFGDRAQLAGWQAILRF
jgi:uncharacterized protein (TIGR03083 family)